MLCFNLPGFVLVGIYRFHYNNMQKVHMLGKCECVPLLIFPEIIRFIYVICL